MAGKSVKSTAKTSAAVKKSKPTSAVKSQVSTKESLQAKLSSQITATKESLAQKPKSFEQIAKEITIAHRFLPLDKAIIKDKSFALTGSALKSYEFARKLDKTLPDLSVEKVQGKRMRQVFSELDNAYKLVVSALHNPGKAIPASANSLPIPRSTRINLSPAAGKELGFSYSRNKPKEQILDVKWEKIKPLLASVSFNTPENRLVKALEQTREYTSQEPVSDSMDRDTTLPGTTTPDATNDTNPELASRIDQLLKKLDQGISEGEVYPEEMGAKRQTSLYQSLGTQHGQALSCSPADAVAYYDFYDLKLAWDPLWSITNPPQQPASMPPILVGFDLRITLEVWNKYIQSLQEFGGSSREIEKRVAKALIYDIYARLLNHLDLVTYNGFTFEELTAISGWAGAQDQFKNYANIEKNREVYTNSQYKVFSDTALSARDNLIDDIVTEILTMVADVPEEATVYLGTPSTLGYPSRVFAPASVNYGLLINFRQEWIPESWQVGELVQTLPLAPKESRRYTKKMTVSKKRARKEIDNSLSVRRANDSLSTRAESQIVQNAQESTSFDATARGGVQVEVFGVGANAGGSTTFKTSAASDSKEAKNKMRESVAKSASEFRSEHKVEVQIEESTSLEEYTESVISNPNEEITVTYLFYELQRQFSVTEALHNIRSVILVANEVPPWSEIDWDWIKRHDWILKRCLLDDSFRPALDFVLEGQEAMEIHLEALQQRKEQLSALVESARKIVESLESKETLTDNQLEMASSALYTTVGKDDGVIEDVFEGIFGGDEGTKIDEYEKRVEGAQARLDRIEQKIKTKQEDLTLQRNALDRAVAEFNKGVLEKHSKVRQVERLVEHLRDNILYYMKAIWSHEPPDQRYLRLYNHEVPFSEYPEDDTDIMVRVCSQSGTIEDVLPGATFEVILPPPKPGSLRKLVEIADIENLLGFKGNYMIFPLRIQSYFTAYMAQSFVGGFFDEEEDTTSASAAGTIADMLNAGSEPAVFTQSFQSYAVDPDPHAAVSPHALMDAASHFGSLPKEIEVKLSELLERQLLSPDSAPQRIIVPSDSLYIEALPGKYPILEDFKLKHRMIDAQKALAEYKSMELENVRAEARLRKLDLSDPEVDKLIRIEGGDADISIDA